MRMAVFQGPERAGDPAANLAALERAAAAAAARGAVLLLTPELALTGYHIGAETVRRLAEPADGPSAEAMAAIARRHKLALCYGYPEAGEDGLIYNAALLLDRDGRRLANHRKSHLYGAIDRGAFAAAQGAPTVAVLDGVTVGILICYDVEFPENVRPLALAGVDLALVPTAQMEPYEFVARSMVPVRAYENQMFMAYANRCGVERELRYVGLSCIAVRTDETSRARAEARS